MPNKKITLQNMKTIFNKTSFKYHATKNNLYRTEFIERNKIYEMQKKKLKRTLVYAFKNVKFYRKKFKEKKLIPSKFNNCEDILEYPFLTKEVLRKKTNELITKKPTRNLMIKVYTGGTTGNPLMLYRNLNDFPRERAFEDYILNMQGINPLCKKVYIRGEVNDKSEKYHAYSRINNTLYLSSHNLSDTNLIKYVELINNFKPNLLYSLPSIATIISEFIKRNNISIVDTIKHALTPSENIYPFQKNLIEEVFGCKVTTMYGNSEHCAIASPCSENGYYHVLPQYGFVELVNEQGDWITNKGEIGEIVATSFTNRGFPLIRYKTGDFARYTDEKCSCGRNYQLWEEIIGRGQAVALTKNKGKISIGSDMLCSIYDGNYGKIKQFKIEQNEIGKLTLFVQPLKNENFKIIKEFLVELFSNQFPNCFEIEVIKKDSDYFNKTDKKLYFVQNIKDINSNFNVEDF